MKDFTVISNEKLLELKRLNEEIESLKELRYFGALNSDDELKLINSKNKLSTLIKSL